MLLLTNMKDTVIFVKLFLMDLQRKRGDFMANNISGNPDSNSNNNVNR